MEQIKQEQRFNALAVPERPIIVENTPVYGFLYNVEEERENKERGRLSIEDYINYFAGMERFVENGGTISEDGGMWMFPDDVHSVTRNLALQRYTSHLMKGLVAIKMYEFDDYIDWQDGEVDENEPRAIVKQSLVDRLIQKEAEKK